MDEFALGKYLQSSLAIVYSDREQIELDPEYQRIGGIWTKEKRQLLIDSLLNGFDVPKLYFHEFVPPKIKDKRKYRYAIIDGKQRLQTVWEFIDGTFPLSEDFKYLRDDTVKAEGLDYPTLAKRYPLIKARFDATQLDIITIRTADIELIEDMFSRLNEAVPLNAPEKRSALGGPLPPAIKKVADHRFLQNRIPFPDKRYRHRDLAAKFLYIEFKDEIVNTKKANLDEMVLDFKEWRKANNRRASSVEITKLVSGTCETLKTMEDVFVLGDSLLRQVGMITVYYHLFRKMKENKIGSINREMLLRFERARDDNRLVVEQSGETGDRVNTDLLEFDKHSQTPNDAYAIRIRLRLLLKFLKANYRLTYDKSIFAFDSEI